MEMLDATLAFAVTLAALATIITVIMESLHRLLRIRKWNLMLTMKKLSHDLAENKAISDKGIWDFFVKIVNNETRANTQKLPTAKELHDATTPEKSTWPRIASFFWDKVFRLSTGGFKKPDTQADSGWLEAIDSLSRSEATRGIFDKVSLEHILRRFVELDEVKDKLDSGRAKIEAQMDKIARKYEEFSSSVTADFKRRSQHWSIIIGILLALIVNVNAARIFQYYLKDQSLALQIISKYEDYEQQAKDAQTRLDDAINNKDSAAEKKYLEQIKTQEQALQGLQEEKLKAENARDAAKVKELESKISAARSEYQKTIKQAYAASQAGQAQQAMTDAGNKLRGLTEAGIPIGAAYFPHCLIMQNAMDPANNQDLCIAGKHKKKDYILPFIGWLLMSIFTGVLIGLGAPFWFDVARRVAEVRSMFGGQKDNEKRLSGKDVDGDSEKRKKLVKDVVNDAIADKS